MSPLDRVLECAEMLGEVDVKDRLALRDARQWYAAARDEFDPSSVVGEWRHDALPGEPRAEDKTKFLLTADATGYPRLSWWSNALGEWVNLHKSDEAIAWTYVASPGAAPKVEK